MLSESQQEVCDFLSNPLKHQDFYEGRAKQILGFIFLLVTKIKRDVLENIRGDEDPAQKLKRSFSLDSVPPPVLQGPRTIPASEQVWNPFFLL